MNIIMDNQQERISEFDLGWLIGLIDGEGCFTLKKHDKKGKIAYSPVITITNTKMKIIEKAGNLIKKLGLSFHLFSNISVKIYYRIEITGMRRVKRFLDEIINKLECRKDQAEKLYSYVNLRLSKPERSPITEEEHKIANLMYELNA